MTFDTIGQMGINFIFVMSQLPYMLRQHEAAQAAEKAEKSDSA